MCTCTLLRCLVEDYLPFLERGSDWISGKGSSPEGGRALHRLPRAVGTAPSCHSSRCVWTTISDIGFEFWGVFVEPSWTRWSLWVPSNLGYCVIPSIPHKHLPMRLSFCPHLLSWYWFLRYLYYENDTWHALEAWHS